MSYAIFSIIFVGFYIIEYCFDLILGQHIMLVPEVLIFLLVINFYKKSILSWFLVFALIYDLFRSDLLGVTFGTFLIIALILPIFFKNFQLNRGWLRFLMAVSLITGFYIIIQRLLMILFMYFQDVSFSFQNIEFMIEYVIDNLLTSIGVFGIFIFFSKLKKSPIRLG